MRKVFLFCVLVAGIAMMTGCKKEQTVVTLKAYIDQDTKTYIGTIGTALYPFWNEGDAVRINGVERNMQQADRTYATIPDVDASTSGYYAIYPSRNVRTMDLVSGTAQINVPSTQSYTKVNGQQRVDMPMAAFSTTEILQFKNLCSILKVNVVNDIPNTDPNYGDLKVERIVVSADGTYPMCGIANVDIAGGTLTMQGTEQNVTLTGEYNDPMETITPGNDHDFYIILAPFNNKAVTVRVETTTGTHYQANVTGATATASHMASIQLNVNQLVGGGDAFLDLGTNVNNAMRTLISNAAYPVVSIGFLYSTPLRGRTVGVDAYRVDDQRDGGIPIYVTLSDRIVTNPFAEQPYAYRLLFYTEASHMYANPTSSHLFENIDPVTQISSFDPNFITDLVTDMSYMFANNESLMLTNDIYNFNTTHVTTMDHMFYMNTRVTQLDLSHFSSASLRSDGIVSMFEGCSNLQSLDLTSFHTSQITTMENLFNGCVKMQTLYINNFDMSNVTTKTNMCLNLSGNFNTNNRAQIWCPSDLVGTTDNPGPLVVGTGLDASKINWHYTVVQ